MAKILCTVQWDPTTKKVVKTYQILNTGPKDKITLITHDSAPFIIKASAKQAKQLGLVKATNAKASDLFQVPKSEGLKAPAKPKNLPAWLKLKCGTIDGNGKYVSWGGVGPDGF